MAINGDDNTLDMVALSEKLESINRVVRAAQQNADDNSVAPAADDHETAASDTAESKSPALDELSLDNEDAEDNRNKR